MIEVKVTQGCVTVSGHAGTAPKGDDLVCAAVSALVYTLAARLCELEDAGRLREVAPLMEDGRAHITWKGNAREAVAMFLAGMRLLEKHAPKSVKVLLTDKMADGRLPSLQVTKGDG